MRESPPWSSSSSDYELESTRIRFEDYSENIDIRPFRRRALASLERHQLELVLKSDYGDATSQNIKRKVKRVFRIKICGITTPQDARLVLDTGADAIGLNFYEKSRRFVQIEEAVQIVDSLENSKLKVVGVFVNAPLSRIEECVAATRLSTVQLHGDEPVEFAKQVMARTGVPVIRAFRAKTGDEKRIEDFVSGTDGLAGVLIDAAVAGQFGGTGEVADWDFVADMVQRLELPVIVAGGLRAGNVSDAISATSAFGVDTASGVESSPGRKDPSMVQDFVSRAKHLLG